jgi:hypothetical protein
VGFPHQHVDDRTAEVWFDTLKGYTREQVGRALARCLGTVEFISCYALVQAVKDEQRELSAVRSTALPLPPRGVGMPPETKEAIAVLKRSTLLPDDPNYLPRDKARERADELARYLDARLAEGTQAPRRERPA